MIERDFFIELLKVTPTNSLIETSGYVDPETSSRLKLISFKEFVPNSVGLIFKLNEKNRGKWVDYFKNADITELLIHYWIFKDNLVIATGFDFFEINTFAEEFYEGKFQKYKNKIQIGFDRNLTKGIPNPKRMIEFISVTNYKGNYYSDIVTEINNEKLNIRFALEQKDFEIISNLISELNSDDRLFFKGTYSGNNELGVSVKRLDIEIDLMINSSKSLISNLLWFQGLENKSKIERLIIQSP